ncbi:MAG: tetratricopeptide repeat protein [Vicinamibacterales bacterium]
MRFLAAAVLLVASVSVAAQGGPATRAAAAARAGWDAVRDGRNQDAARLFADAVALEPRDATHHLGVGLSAYLLGRSSDARESLRTALDLAPTLTPASLVLAEILYRESNIDEALRVLEQAQRYAPQDASVAARLETLRAETTQQRDFFQSQGSHFTVLFEGPADEAIALRALEILEEAYFRVGTALYTFPERPITVVLSTEQQFRDVTRSPEWAAAAYDGRIRVPMRGALERDAELQRVLTHEFTHALVQRIAPRGVPTWLNEGIAVMFEPSGREWAEATLSNTRGRIPLPRLANGFGSLSGLEARVAYAQSADAVRQLFDLAGPAAVVAMLQDLAAGRPLAESFEERMLLPFERFAEGVAPAN